MLGETRAEPLHQPPDAVGKSIRVRAPRKPEQRYGNSSRRRVDQRLDPASKPHTRRSELPLHRRLPANLQQHDDLAEYGSAFEAGEPLREILDRKLGVDHWGKPGRHLVEAFSDVAHG